MSDTEINLIDIKKEFLALVESLNLAEKQVILSNLQTESSQAGFWNDDSRAKQIMQQISRIERELSQTKAYTEKLEGLIELETIVSDSKDKQLAKELSQEKREALKEFKSLKIETYLSGEYDDSPAILSIHAGQGGTEAMDWASMLQRMYQRYFERSNLNFQVVELSRGEEAGIKSVTFIVKGTHAYGYLKGESGTHRLVRLSPFNSDNLRQTSFAGVEVTPLIQSGKDISINDDDLEWQFFRAGGSGGQNVNKVSTAVRVRHTPSGIVVSSQAERTQVRNREIALEILLSKLEKIKKDEEQAKTSKLKGEHKIAGWGNQIRNYVLHPYQMIKDVRTGVETSNSESVLDGDLQEFIDAEVAFLAQNNAE